MFKPPYIDIISSAKYRVFAEDQTQISKCEVYGTLWIGFGSYLNPGCMLRSYVKIGRYCSIGRNCSIGLGLHDYNNISTSSFFHFDQNTNAINIFADESKKMRVIIGNDVWIGDHVYIKSGLKIGDGAVIGACSLVTKNIDNYSIVGGVPAHLIKKRFNDKTIEELNKIKFWSLSPEILQEVFLKFNNINEQIDYLKSLSNNKDLYFDVNYKIIEN